MEIRSQVQAVYRKLDVAGRAEAVTERAGLASCPGRALSAMTTSPKMNLGD